MGVGARELAAVCGGLADVPPGVMVTDISLDSRRVAAGGLFLACAGRRTHGLAALPEALARGAREWMTKNVTAGFARDGAWRIVPARGYRLD